MALVQGSSIKSSGYLDGEIGGMSGSARDMQGVRERRRGTSRVRNDFSPISGGRAIKGASPQNTK